MYPISFQSRFWNISSEPSFKNATVFSSVAESAVWSLLRSLETLGKTGTAVDPAGELRNETAPKATEGRKPQRPSEATSLWLQALYAPFWALLNIQKNATYYNFLFCFSINLYGKTHLPTKHQNIKYFFPCRTRLKFCFLSVLHPHQRWVADAWVTDLIELLFS